jgi:hypothetical protein
MQRIEELDSGAIERLRKQGEFLLRVYRAEFAKDPISRATESSRSNVIAMQDKRLALAGDFSECSLPSEVRQRSLIVAADIRRRRYWQAVMKTD